MVYSEVFFISLFYNRGFLCALCGVIEFFYGQNSLLQAHISYLTTQISDLFYLFFLFGFFLFQNDFHLNHGWGNASNVNSKILKLFALDQGSK